MRIADFKNINTEYESDHTLVQSGELEGKLFTLKSYKSGSYNAHLKHLRMTSEIFF